MREPITRREAALRTVAIAALSGLAVVHLVALPYAVVQGAPIAAVCAAAIAASVRVASSLATAGGGGGRAAWRAVLAPGAAVALVALGPAPVHHHGLAPASISAHRVHAAAVDPSAAARFRPGFGGHTGHYVYANATPPHLPPWALALALGAAAGFVWLAGAALARRSAPRAAAPSPALKPSPGRS